MHIGTSSQISIVVNKNTAKELLANLTSNYSEALDVVPYKADDVVITAASLTGEYFHG